MPKFGVNSRERLSSCDDRLQKVFNEVIKHIDCSVLEGHRSGERQDKLFDLGKTKVKYPKGKHNAFPSTAVDITPWPVNWEDREKQTLFAGFSIGIAKSMGITLRWGGDWNRDFDVKNNTFDDFPHFEIVE